MASATVSGLIMNAYNQAVRQRTRNYSCTLTGKQELASSQATALLQQLIADLHKLVSNQQTQLKKLQDQIQADSASALQQSHATATATIRAKSAARTAGLEQGAGIGVGAPPLLFGLIFGIRWLTRDFAVINKAKSA